MLLTVRALVVMAHRSGEGVVVVEEELEDRRPEGLRLTCDLIGLR